MKTQNGEGLAHIHDVVTCGMKGFQHLYAEGRHHFGTLSTEFNDATLVPSDSCNRVYHFRA